MTLDLTWTYHGFKIITGTILFLYISWSYVWWFLKNQIYEVDRYLNHKCVPWIYVLVFLIQWPEAVLLTRSKNFTDDKLLIAIEISSSITVFRQKNYTKNLSKHESKYSKLSILNQSTYLFLICTWKVDVFLKSTNFL